MDTVRSEYSEDGGGLTGRSVLSTSRFGASVASLAHSFAGSFDSQSTRSDFVSNYEQKFLQRKAEKKKRRERDRRLASANQLTADEKRRADREAERQARRAEMATWLPSAERLQEVERERKKRSRERMRDVLSWYPTLSPDERKDPTLRREAEMYPFFSPESQYALEARRSEHEARVLGQVAAQTSAVHHQIVNLNQKLAVLEELNQQSAPVPTRGRGAPAKCRRRSQRRSSALSVLAPLAKRDRHNPPVHRSPPPVSSAVATFFRDTPEERMMAHKEEDRQVQQFLALHKRLQRMIPAAVQIQSMWRMHRKRRAYLRWCCWRRKKRRKFFQIWVLSFRITKQANRSIARKCLRAWKEEVDSAIEFRMVELRLFHEAELHPELPKIVVNLVFTSSDYDDAYTRKVLAHPTKHFVTGFVNSAFAAVEDVVVPTKNRVRLIRAQHLEARRAVAKRIVQRTFLQWKRAFESEKRIGVNAQLCIKRAARMAFQSRPVWAGEKLMTIFEMWARWSAFNRCKRLGIPMPQFARSLPLWEIWLHNYQERQIRLVKAVAKAPLARMRRCFRSFRVFAGYALHKRLSRELATRHFATKLSRAVMREWREAIAESAAYKKLVRSVLGGWRHYAHRKTRLRPLQQRVVGMRLTREYTRAWSSWRNVQLRSCFKRELNHSRLDQPVWRSKVQRVILLWLDIRPPLVKWKVFTAWKQVAQRRKLFLTFNMHCENLRRRHLTYGVFSAWKAVVWKQEDEFLEDRLRLSAWDAYKEISPLTPMLFYGCYSAAGAIFGGVPISSQPAEASNSSSSTEPSISHNVDLAQRQHAIHEFHLGLSQASAAEARNLILSTKHLLNAIDELSGNSALHVAVQIEDPIRRVEVLGLLLSEGAVTWDHPNKHGMKPRQLTSDANTIHLLDNGVYAYHSSIALRRAKTQASSADPSTSIRESRLLWCLTTIMSGEYARGERIAGDMRRAWHSVLRDELWLRQGRMYFSATSEFSPDIVRCRAFLNGMKRRICRNKEDILLEQLARQENPAIGASANRPTVATSLARQRSMLLKSATRQMLRRNLSSTGERVDLLTWLQSTAAPFLPDSLSSEEARAHELMNKWIASLGKFGAYGELLLSPTLNDEGVERSLIHSFVGVLFSLQFSEQEVLQEAARLDALCTQLEGAVLTHYEAITQAELSYRASSPHGLPLFRFFTEPSDAEFFFKQQLLLVDIELNRRHALESTVTPLTQDLLTSSELLLVKAQRKLRRTEKKIAASHCSLQHYETRLTEVLLSHQRRVIDISNARMQLEHERLRMANLQLKQLEYNQLINEIGAIKGELKGAAPSKTEVEAPHRVVLPVMAVDSMDALVETTTLRSRREFIEIQLMAYGHAFRELQKCESKHTTKTYTEVRQLHRTATANLRMLFVVNLMRSCCCWLVENMTADSATGTTRGPSSTITAIENPKLVESNNKAPNAQPAKRMQLMKRTSSTTNSRVAFETLHRSSASVELAEQHLRLMRDNYSSSSQVLFETQRAGLLHRGQLSHADAKSTARAVFTETNPITGEREIPPTWVIDASAISDVGCTQETDSGDPKLSKKKRQYLQARARRQQEKQTTSTVPHDDVAIQDDGEVALTASSESPRKASSVDVGVIQSGDYIGFGNFVSSPVRTDKPSVSLNLDVNMPPARMAGYLAASESLWKRGGVVRRPGDPLTGSKKDTSFDIFASAEDEIAFNTSFRVTNAMKSRVPTPQSRRQSTMGMPAALAHVDAPREPTEQSAISAEPHEPSSPKSDDAHANTGDLADEHNTATDHSSDAHLAASSSTHRSDSEEGSPREPIPPLTVQVASAPKQPQRVQDVGLPIPQLFDNVVSATEESQFFNDTLLQYLDRMRRDSFVATIPLMPATDPLAETTVQAETPPALPVPVNSFKDTREEPIAPLLVGEVNEAPPAAGSVGLVQSEEQVQAELMQLAHIRPLRVECTALFPLPKSTMTPLAPESSSRGSEIASRGIPSPETTPTGEFRLSGKQVAMSSKQSKRRLVQATMERARQTRSKPTMTLKPASSPIRRPPSEEAKGASKGDQIESVGACLSETEIAPPSLSVPKISVAIQSKSTVSSSISPPRPAQGPGGESRGRQPFVAPRTEIAFAPEQPVDDDIAPPCPMAASGQDRPKDRKRLGNGPVRRPARALSERVSLSLDGERMRTRTDPSTSTEQTVSTGLGEEASTSSWINATTANLTKAQRSELWKAFTDKPLSAPVQDAYAAVYPHLYEPATSPTVVVRTPAEAAADPWSLPAEVKLDRNRRFWSAAEGYRSIGAMPTLMAMDPAAVCRRRAERARAIMDEFLAPEAPRRLPWLPQYPQALVAVHQQLEAATPGDDLFRALQEQAQLEIRILVMSSSGGGAL